MFGHGGLYPSASIVSTNNDMFYFQMIDSIVQYREKVEIGVDYHIGHITVYKNLSGPSASDLVGWYTAVTTSDPKKFGCL
jgi:hypothetical protein